jgi:hypothetical protein
LPVSRLALFVGAGPYINYGVSGKLKGTVKYTMDDGNESVIKEEFSAFKKTEDGGGGLKRSDFGVGAVAGLKLGGGLFVNAGYQLSLSNIADKEDNSSYRNRGLQLTLGYMF